MENMQIIKTSDISDQLLQTFQDDLSVEFNAQVDPNSFSFKSVEAPSWIRLAADLQWWQQAFGAYAALYVAEIVKEAAKDSWKNRSKAISLVVGAASKLKHLAKSIAKLSESIEPRTKISLFIPYPNEYFGTILYLRTETPELTELDIALFAYYIPNISLLLSSHKTSGIEVGTGYSLELQDDATLHVRWFDNNTLEKQQTIFSLNDN